MFDGCLIIYSQTFANLQKQFTGKEGRLDTGRTRERYVSIPNLCVFWNRVKRFVTPLEGSTQTTKPASLPLPPYSAGQPSPWKESESQPLSASQTLQANQDLNFTTYTVHEAGTVRRALAEAAEKLSFIQEVEEGLGLLPTPAVVQVGPYIGNKETDDENESATNEVFGSQNFGTNDMSASSASPSLVTGQSEQHLGNAPGNKEPGSAQKEGAEAFPRSHQVRSSTISHEGTGENDPHVMQKVTSDTDAHESVAIKDNSGSDLRTRELQGVFDQVAHSTATNFMSAMSQNSAQAITDVHPKRGVPITLLLWVGCLGILSGLLCPVIDISVLLANRHIWIGDKGRLSTRIDQPLNSQLTAGNELALVPLPETKHFSPQPDEKNALVVVINSLRKVFSDFYLASQGPRMPDSIHDHSLGMDNTVLRLSFLFLSTAGGVAFAVALISVVLLQVKRVQGG